ncbi:hypothetical protein [Dethiobacter alkaliphilus]|uniref:hypothetical protein n=1 Tax=Dethiobacter alkaliphilus TaxID=427926 RepID=UPI002227895A|nr:hypothetical protein [Dethiobacter alkaliphilus]MCW3488851.1 hypothetical protein [Dethiobacter alkaliphilus]
MQKKIVNTAAAKEMDQIVSLLGDLLKEISSAFMNHRLSLKYQKASGDISGQIRKTLVSLSETASEMGGPEALAVQSATLNLSKVFYDTLHLGHQVESKVKEKVMFSEEAVAEMSDLLRRTTDLLPHVADVVRTCNPLIVEHVNKEADELRNSAANSTVMHEARLCKGQCHPKASVIFMQMLQNLQDILWHFKALSCEQRVPKV